MALLEVTNLSVQFNTHGGILEAIDGANLIIKEGEIVGLVGESGCGKTTLARAILKVIPCPPGNITQGEIVFQGNNILGLGEKELNSRIRGKAISVIPQDPLGAFNPLFPVGTQIRDLVQKTVNGRSGSKRAEKPREEMTQKILMMLNRVQLPSPNIFLRKYPHELSGGQRQRIMIAIALLTDPLLVIADEPTTFLDVTVQSQILVILKVLVREQRLSVLYITHNLAVASTITDSIVVMYAGQIMESAPTDVLFVAPAHPYTRKLLDCVASHSKEIKGIPGNLPSLINPPKGCRFASRCDRVESQCFRERPPQEDIGRNHWIHCYHPILT